MGDRMGSSPIDRTKKMTCTFIVQVFFLQGSKGLERDVKKTAQCAVFSPRRDSNRVSGAKKRRIKRLRPQGCGASPIDRTNRKDDNAIVFFSFSAKNDAALPLISKNSFQPHLKNTDITA